MNAYMDLTRFKNSGLLNVTGSSEDARLHIEYTVPFGPKGSVIARTYAIGAA